MADIKISALPAASTPLAGTEVLPIVQTGVTDKVAVSNLTAGRAVSAASLTLTTTALTPANGGTGLATYAVGDLVYASGATTLAKLADVATGNVLISGGVTTAPSYGKVGLTTHISGTLAVGNGGTGLTALTSGRIPYASATDTLGTSSSLTFNGTRFGLGTTPVTSVGFAMYLNTTGSTVAYGQLIATTIQSDVTSTAFGLSTSIGTAAGAFSTGSLYHLSAYQNTIGAGSSVGTQAGVFIDSSLTGATNNYAAFLNIPAASGRWNVYANGTAQNAFAGLTRFGGVTVPVNTVDITGSLGRGAPVTKTSDFTLAATENWLIINQAGTTTVTLPAASSWTGREVHFKTIQAQTLVSNASNVVPQAGGAAGTAILAGTAGNWATCVSDGTNWVVMQGGGLL